MTAPAILIVHSDRKTQRILERILGATGLPIAVVDDAFAATDKLREHAPRLLVLDGKRHANSDDDLLAVAASVGVEACLTLLPNPEFGDIPRLLSTGAVSNLLARPMPTMAEELTTTAQKLLRGDVFGLEKYLLWAAACRTATLTRAEDRRSVVHEIAESIRAAGQRPRLVQLAMLIADELLSNAVHNAPIDNNGNRPRRNTMRTSEFPLLGDDEVTVRWACDARYLAIEVADQHGSLTREQILHALSRDHVRATVNGEDYAGAGLGLAMVYRACDHLIFNIAPGKRTEIIALIDLRNDARDDISARVARPDRTAPSVPAIGDSHPLASSYNIFIARASATCGA